MFRKQSFLFCLVVLLSMTAILSAATTVTWDRGAGTDDWNTGQNWSTDSVPPNSSSYYAAIAMAAGPVVPAASTVNVYRILLNGTNGTLTVNGGTVNVGNHIYVADVSTAIGTLTVNSGTVNITSTLYIARDSGSVGTVNVLGGSIICATLNLAANGGTAAPKINIEAGTLTFTTGSASVTTWILNGWIKAYNGAGTLIVDTTTIPGKTILSARNQSKAVSPNPANSATNIARNVILSWTAGAGTTSHNVYFGTTTTPTLQGNQTAASFNPGTLDFDTTYYWRIDEVGGSGTLSGDLWSFTTVSGKAKNPDPAIGTTNVSVNKILRWAANSFAASHDIYFGTSVSDVTNTSRLLGDLNGNGTVEWNDIALLGAYWLTNPAGTEPYAGVNFDNIVDSIDLAMLAPDWRTNAGPVFKGNQDANTFNPGSLAVDTTYYWRVDEVNGPETAIGNIWSFSTQSAKAYNPNPANGSSNAITTPTLSWTAGAGATSHNVYFGTTTSPASQGNQSGTTFSPGTLANTTTYYWRVDEIGGYGTVTGDLWSFTTVPLNTTPIYQYLSWRSDPANSVVVNWWNGSAQGDSTVDYGSTSLYGSTVTVPTVSNFHHVELTGLTPGATIHYRPRSSDGTVGADATYTVPPASPTTFRFAVFGDTRCTGTTLEPFYTRHQQLCNWILAQNYDFAIQGGDTVDEGGATNGGWEYADFYRLESNLSKSKVIMATMGNHEVQPGSNGPYIYYDLYTNAFPANGTSGNNSRVYSFNYGNAHFVCLSSYQIDLNSQATWLAADLTAAKANPNIKWIFVVFHAPMYTQTDASTGRGNRTDEIAAWGPIFDQYHVDIAFQSHNHVYERSYPLKAGVIDTTGTVYVTTGLGGAGFEPIGSSNRTLFAASYSASSTTYGSAATCVSITGNSLTATTISQDSGIVRDSFTVTK